MLQTKRCYVGIVNQVARHSGCPDDLLKYFDMTLGFR